MSETQNTDTGTVDLSQAERARIRAEVRYALVAANEARPPVPLKGRWSRLLEFLGNGFVLLLVGSIITSFLVPEFQRRYENRRQQAALMQDSLAQFLAYSNSLWQEYYAVLPLTQAVEIDQATYLQYVGKIADIKLKRYDAYAKVVALSIAFRDPKNREKDSAVEAALKRYAVSLNTASASIDKWLTGLYCTPVKRARSPCASFDPAFDGYAEHTKIKQFVVDVGNKDTDDVAALIVARINEQ
jgi:hypothetical protein